MKCIKPPLLSSFIITLALGLSACGGGGNTPTPNTTPNTTPTSSEPEGVLYSFGSTSPSFDDGAAPEYGHLLLASDGNFYGMTFRGGGAGQGAVVKITPKGQTSVLWSFGGTGDGQFPENSLIQSSNGNFYGMTPSGGANGQGIVFKLTPSGTETVLYSFGGGTGDGAVPSGSLIQYNGNFYGMTNSGGAYNAGTVFELTPTGTETVLFSFKGGTSDGMGPMGSLIQYNGNFYGMTQYGGANSTGAIGNGVVFKLTPTGTETILHSFAGGTGDGAQPYGSLIQYNGNFYGVTISGGSYNMGTVFELTTSGTSITEKILHAFAGGTSDGQNPYGNLIQDSNGNFYGMTSAGGVNGKGTIFSLNSISGAETVLWSFGGKGDGQNPQGSLTQDGNGNFYGMTQFGGANGVGTILTFNPSSMTETVLHNFTGTGDGAHPHASLIQGSDGNFYGMTTNGGTYGVGTVFQLTPQGTETIMWSFGGAGDGQAPQGSLIQGSDGNFYGMTQYGGPNGGNGTVFKLTPQGTETVLHSFVGISDGSQPAGSLIQGNDGNFYGLTYSGGSYNQGTIFKLTLQGTETVLYSFAGGMNGGSGPSGSLIQGSDGNFYGMTANGGTYNGGTIFELTVGTSVTEQVLYSFVGGTGDGAHPYGSLIQGADGNFYGLTANGGTYNGGTIFELAVAGASSVTENLLWSFGNTGDGAIPNGSLIQDNQGNFYWMTFAGGAHDQGAVFQLTPQGSEAVLWSFGGTGDGVNPYGSLIQANDGNFYGMTQIGGSFNLGTVVEIKHP